MSSSPSSPVWRNRGPSSNSSGRNEGRRFAGGRHEGGRGRSRFGGGSNPDTLTKITIPKNACGLFVGKGGRNLKELKERSDIRSIYVDSQQGIVSVVGGTEEGIKHVERRILMASSIACNADGYFPEWSLTYLVYGRPPTSSSCSSSVRFQRVNKYGSQYYYPVDLAQLDKNRDYYTIEDASDDGIDGRLGYLDIKNDDRGVSVYKKNDDHITIGLTEEKYRQFFSLVITEPKNWNHMVLEESSCVSMSIGFGKTFLSSVPDQMTYPRGVHVTLDELQQVPFGKNGLRSEFVGHLNLERQGFLSSVLFQHDDEDNGYELVESGKFITINCVSEKEKKRYYIRLQPESASSGEGGDDDDESDRSSATHSAKEKALYDVSVAKTYYEVLKVPPTATTRQIKISYQRMSLLVHPEMNPNPMAAKAIAILNEAKACLRDSSLRRAYDQQSVLDQLPNNRFEYALVQTKEKHAPLPEVVEFRRNGRKIALVTSLDGGHLSNKANVEFRTTIETDYDEIGMDWTLRAKLQRAWNNRTEDGKLQFPKSTTTTCSACGSTHISSNDWLIVDSVRNKRSWTYSNGSYSLTISETTGELFGSAIQGLNIHLKSLAISDILSSLKMKKRVSSAKEKPQVDFCTGDDDGAKLQQQLIVDEMWKLQQEAERIANVINGHHRAG